MKAMLAASGLLLTMPLCERPPIEYQGESVPAVILFADPAVVDAVCRGLVPNADPTRQILACTNPGNNTILFPDPCLFDDNTAALLCHERSHLRRPDGKPGWVHG